MDLLINGEKLEVPPGTALVLLTPIDDEAFNVTTMLLVGDAKSEKQIMAMSKLSRGLAYIAEEQTEDVMEAGAYALAEDENEYPASLLLADGLTLEDIEPDGYC